MYTLDEEKTWNFFLKIHPNFRELSKIYTTMILVVAFVIFSWEGVKNNYLGLTLDMGFPSSQGNRQIQPLIRHMQENIF